MSKASKFVEANFDRLNGYSYRELVNAGRLEGFDSRAGFSAYKRALTAAGIDYDGLQADHRAGKEAAHAERFAGAEVIRLVSDAAASHSRFAITTPAGEPVWYGRFFGDEGDEQSAAELAAAKKAVWLTGKYAAGRAVKLHLTVDAEWLTWANESANGAYSKRGGKAKQLAAVAAKAGIALEVEWTSGATNVADKFTRCRGFLRWQDGIAALASA